jgi:hypothetical protein
MTRIRLLALAALLPCAACTTLTRAPPATVQIVEERQPEWMVAAAPADIDRIHRLDEAWLEALRQARSRGFRRAIEGEGALLEPDAALPRAAPSPGSYHCRVIKLGQQSGRGAAFAAYKPFFCYVDVDGDTLSIVKQTGSQRPAGFIYPDRDDRHIFLGSVALGDETSPLAYGDDEKRDLVGVVERVGPFRWRLVMPWPQSGAILEVFELVPAVQ